MIAKLAWWETLPIILEPYPQISTSQEAIAIQG